MFRPSEHSVTDVLNYLSQVSEDPAEVGRVLAAERTRLARPEILTRYSLEAGGRPHLEEGS